MTEAEKALIECCMKNPRSLPVWLRRRTDAVRAERSEQAERERQVEALSDSAQRYGLGEYLSAAKWAYNLGARVPEDRDE